MAQHSVPERVLHLYRSNRVEALADAAAELFATPASGAGPLDPEHIVVQGRGMAVWLSMQLSQRHGIWAGGRFLYPRNFLGELFEGVLGTGISPGYDRRELMWAVLSILGEGRSELEALTAYTTRDDRGQRRSQLARRIADTFDQYLTYRPDWVRAWQGGDDAPAPASQSWQPALWRALTERLGEDHAAGLERALLSALGGDATIEGLPPRIAVFGIAGLPPMYARILAALSKRVEVHWFLPSPATGYWADLATPERVARAGEEAAALHLEIGHPLLASLGRLGAELQIVLAEELEALGVAESEPRGDMHVAPPTRTVLERLQHDVLRAEVGAHGAIAVDDRSVALHACHSPMREVEVLHDQLLDLTERHGMKPHEIVVMMPDVESYAPLIEAVFEREPGDDRFIPYRIADRHLRRDSPVVDAFMRTLELVGGRAPVSAVIDLIALGPVQRRFDIGPEEIDELRRWIAESGIRWGIDEDHRAAHGQPAVRANTWRFGLERMLLGYAMTSDGRDTFEGTLAYDEIEGQTAVLLGKLATFCDALFATTERLDALRPVGEHAASMAALLDAIIAVDADTAAEHRLLRGALVDIAASAEAAGFEEAVGVEVMRSLLDDFVDQAEPARGFLAGGVTFCAMIPMRNIPFRVVCLLGLSDQAFPRARRPVDFDLMAMRGDAGLTRRPGDRSRRDDDRYLFLEALLAARERVLLIFTGQSVRDGSTLAPSVVVSELLDAIAASHPESDVEDALVTRHPLQPFNQRYFEPGSELFSYSTEYCEAALRLARGGREPAPPLFSMPLPAEEVDAISLGELVRFFEGPARYLMTRRLGVDLRDDALAVADREPVDLDNLERWAVGQQLLELRVDGVSIEETERLARATGVLPIGTPGSLDHRAILDVVEPIAERVRALREGGRLADLAISGRLSDGTLLSGEVSDRWERGQLRHQFARVSGKQLVSTWIRHLALCWRGSGADSFVVGRAPSGHARSTVAYRLAPVSDPEPLLRALVRIYHRGASEPLPLFPKAALKLMQALRAGRAEEQALRSAHGAFIEERRYDAHIQRAFGERQVIDAAFVALAREVFGPLVAQLEEVR